MKTFAEWMTARRKDVGVSANELAAQLDISKCTQTRIANGTKTLSRGEIIAIAYILNAEDQIPELMALCGYDDVLTPLREREQAFEKIKKAMIG